MERVTRTTCTTDCEALDELFEVLADQCRRTVVAELSRGGPSDVESLAEEVAADAEQLTKTDAEISLIHSHLPRLEDAGVVEFDRTASRCELARTETGMSARRVLNEARTHV